MLINTFSLASISTFKSPLPADFNGAEKKFKSTVLFSK
jgi:hypothetical protein